MMSKLYDCPTPKCHGSPFDRLPDELLVKIFRCLLTDRRERRPFHGLRLTCKRFLYLINYKVYNSFDDHQTPSLYLQGLHQRASVVGICNGTRDCCCIDGSTCRSRFSWIKYRRLYIAFSHLHGHALERALPLKLYVNTIMELELVNCNLYAGALDYMLHTLKNVKRLRLGYNEFDHQPARGKTLRVGPPQNRTLTLLGISTTRPKEMLEYCLRHLPARELRIATRPAFDLDWLGRYLAKHRPILRRFQFTLFRVEAERVIGQLRGFKYRLEPVASPSGLRLEIESLLDEPETDTFDWRGRGRERGRK